MNPQRRGSNRSNILPSAAPLSNTPYAINVTPKPSSMPSYSTFSPDLKWHNILPEDFNGRSKSSNSDRPSSVNLKKRPSGTFENIDAIIQSHVHHTVTSSNHLSPVPPAHTLSSSPLPSPTKRPRALSNATTKTPTKSKSSASIKGSGSGMQTPPPSSTATARKRGRPSKKFYSASVNNSSAALSPQEPSPTKKLYLGGNHYSQSLTESQNKFESQHPDSGIAMPGSDEAPSTNFNSKNDENIWGGGLDYMAGLGGNSHGLGHSASYDWSSIRNNASMDNLASLTDIFGPPQSARRRQSQSSFTDEASDNPTFSFLEFDDPYGLEMPLDVNPNLLFSSTTNSAASSMIGGLGEDFKPFPFVQQPYQHQHLQHLREQELEIQRQRQLQEKISKERLRRERTVAASGGRIGSRHSSVLGHSRSDGFLHGPGRRQDSRAANFNAAAIKRCSSGIGHRGEMGRVMTPEPQPRMIQQPRMSQQPPSTLRRTTERIPTRAPRVRTEVILAISPGGRAKTETTVIYESSDTDIEDPVIEECDSLEESDSSFDDDVPRGLGPDGIDYTLYRQRKVADQSQDMRAAPHRLNIPSDENSSRAPPPRTPTRRSPLKMPLSGTSRRSNGFAASTAAAATSTGGRLDSSPRLPTPLKSSPPSGFNRRLRERVRRASHSSLTPSQSMSAIGTPRLGPMQEVSDESEAETVVDGTEMGILDDEEEEDGDALHALKRVMMARRIGDGSGAVSLECTPTKSRPGSAIKQQIFSTGSSIGSCSSSRHGQMHPALLRPSPVKKKLFEEQLLRSASRQNTAAGGGFHPHDQRGLRYSSTVDTDSNSATPTKRLTRAMERKIHGSPEGTTRCVCGETDDGGGTMMVQCDSCNSWLHLKCVGYNRKSLPKEFECMFCEVQAARAETLHKGRGRTRSRRLAGEGSVDGRSVTSTPSRMGRMSGR